MPYALIHVPIISGHSSLSSHLSRPENGRAESCICSECQANCIRYRGHNICPCHSLGVNMPPRNPFAAMACQFCSLPTSLETGTEIGGRMVCNPCRQEHFFSCAGCRRFSSTLYQQLTPAGILCNACCNRAFVICQNCRNYHSRETTTHIGNERFSCSDCLPHYIQCDSCARFFTRSQVIRDEESASNYCVRCNERCRFYRSSTFNINPYQRKVGFEIEFCSRETPLIGEFGHIKGDGSISPRMNDQGIEFASHIFNGDRLLRTINKVCSLIRDTGGYVNQSCGVHIHLDMRETHTQTPSSPDILMGYRDNVYDWWGIFERLFFGMVAPSRRTNTYTRSVFERNSGSDRYRTLNRTAYEKFGTFEIRLHHGTLSPSKLRDWVLLLLSFFDVFQHIPLNPARLNAVKKMTDRELLIFFFQQIKISRKLQKKVLQRIKTYNGESGSYYLNLAKKEKNLNV